MIDPSLLPECLSQSPVRIVVGPGKVSDLGALARAEGFRCILLVTDPGIVQAGHVDRARQSLIQEGLNVFLFDGAHQNPTTHDIIAGVKFAQKSQIDAVIGLGGGSAMDCAKGINILLTNGGQITDYWGCDKTSEPLLPMILVPATAGTGSEAQSFALISDPVAHCKMACGDRRLPTQGGLRPRIAILDPDLTRTQPPAVAGASAIDAVSHAVETAGTNCRNELSRKFSHQAWTRLDRSFEPALSASDNSEARVDMLIGAHLAGAAIEHSMLGAAHACANPLTARFGVAHGQAVGLMLPWVVRFNAGNSGGNPYADLCPDAEQLASRLEEMLSAAGLKQSLTELDVPKIAIPELAESAAEQWTARFNPHPVGIADLMALYEAAL